MDKLKELINRLVDVKKLIITVWIMLWVVLIILDVFKLCFNVWYPVVSNNQKFISVCNFIDNHEWLKTIIFTSLYFINIHVCYLMFTKRYKYKNKFIFIILSVFFIGNRFLKEYNNLIGIICECVILIILPVLYNLKNKVYKRKIFNIGIPIVLYIIVNAWQSQIMFIRGIEAILSTLPTAVVLILQADYYVFIIFTWIGVSYIMGSVGIGWWWSQQITKLKALKEKELKKAHPDMDVVAEYDAKIKNYEQKLKEVK